MGAEQPFQGTQKPPNHLSQSSSAKLKVQNVTSSLLKAPKYMKQNVMQFQVRDVVPRDCGKITVFIRFA